MNLALKNQEAWLVEKPGVISNLKLVNRPLKPLAADEIRVKVRSIGLNFADILAILGLYSATPKEPFTPGLEFAGDVVQIGSDVKSFKVGESVMGVTRFGAYAQYIDIHPAYCDSLPKDWSYSEGCAYIAQAVTAWYALKHLGDLKPNQNVLIHSAAGGVGLFAMNYTKMLGARPIGTVSSDRKVAYLHERGFPDVIVRSDHMKADIEKLVGASKINLALTAIGGEVQRDSFDLLAPMGRLIVYGAAEYAPTGNRVNWIKTIYQYLRRPKYDPLEMIPLNRSIMAFNIIWLWEYRGLLRELLSEMRNCGMVKPVVDREFPFSEAVEAVNHLKTGKTIGKVVIKVS